MTTNGLRTCLGRFARREDGSIAIELVIIIPALFWAYLAMFATFDAYRAHSLNQKASYTISDTISRERDSIDGALISGLRTMHAYLMNTPLDNVSLRITLVSYDAANDSFALDWSHGAGVYPALINQDVANWHDRMPIMANGERLIVLESWVDYSPPFDTGLSDREIKSFVFTKPRYAGHLGWEGGV